MRLYEDVTFKIAGVTYKNADRHSRQTILRKLKFGDYPFNSGDIDLEFREYEFEGEPAVGVFYNGEQVGNIAKKDLPVVLPLMDRYAGLSDFAITGGGDKYGLEIAVYFKKAA